MCEYVRERKKSGEEGKCEQQEEQEALGERLFSRTCCARVTELCTVPPRPLAAGGRGNNARCAPPFLEEGREPL